MVKAKLEPADLVSQLQHQLKRSPGKFVTLLAVALKVNCHDNLLSQ